LVPPPGIPIPLSSRSPLLSSTPLSTARPEPTGTALPLRHADDPRVRRYRSCFADIMEMRAPSEPVATYLDSHGGWFRRCASPMTVTPLGANGYCLTLGRFGNFGFEVEPTIGLELLPQSEGVYRIVTVPVGAAGVDTGLDGLYDVDFQASLRLDPSEAQDEALTLVRWELDLSVWIRLPGVITLLPENLVQSSGEHLLRQIVRQISRRLTWKVQEDFHASHDLPCPPRRRAQF
jgi:hypothetical protein